MTDHTAPPIINLFSDDELKAELEKRKEIRKLKLNKYPDLSELEEALQGYINDLDDGSTFGCPADWVYEHVILAYFGEKGFEWINTQEKRIQEELE